MMYTYFCHNWGMGIMGWSWLIWLVIIVLLVWLGVKLFNQGNTPAKEDSALTILRERYARGEISKEEFEEKKKDLS